MRRARSASRSKPSREVVRGSEKPVGSVDESATGSVNPWSRPFEQAGQSAIRCGPSEVDANCVLLFLSDLARLHAADYVPSCTEHGARVGRSRAWGPYAEAEGQQVRGT